MEHGSNCLLRSSFHLIKCVYIIHQTTLWPVQAIYSCISCYLGDVTVEERYEQYSYCMCLVTSYIQIIYLTGAGTKVDYSWLGLLHTWRGTWYVLCKLRGSSWNSNWDSTGQWLQTMWKILSWIFLMSPIRPILLTTFCSWSDRLGSWNWLLYGHVAQWAGKVDIYAYSHVSSGCLFGPKLVSEAMS